MAAVEQRRDWALVALFWIAAFAVVYVARGLVMPIVVACFIALALNPVRRFLRRLGVPSAVGAGAIVVVLIGVFAATTLLLLFPLIDLIENLPTTLEKAEAIIRRASGLVAPIVERSQELRDLAGDGGEEVTKVAIDDQDSILAITRATPTVIAQTVLVLALIFFLLASGDMLYEKLVAVSSHTEVKRASIAIAADIERQLSRYFFTITVINAVLGVCVGLTFAMLGMPDPFIFGFLAFLLNYVPYLGSAVGIGVAYVTALVETASFLDASWPAFAYWAWITMEGQFVTPYLLGRSLKLNALVVLVSIAVWAWLWSAVGMVLATPMLIALKAFCDRSPGLRGLGLFLGPRGTPSREDADLLVDARADARQEV